MAVKETQSRIRNTAVSLFNAHGTGRVTLSQIAAECGISKGHLNYHYKNKEELILAIVLEISKEIETNWYKDDSDLAVKHFPKKFVRHMELNYRYRFFFRELPSLLRSNELIQRRFIETRRRRISAFNSYLERMAKAELIQPVQGNQELEDYVTATWVFADNWINYVEASGARLDAEQIRTGYRILKTLLKPILTEETYKLMPEPGDLAIRFLDAR